MTAPETLATPGGRIRRRKRDGPREIHPDSGRIPYVRACAFCVSTGMIVSANLPNLWGAFSTMVNGCLIIFINYTIRLEDAREKRGIPWQYRAWRIGRH